MEGIICVVNETVQSFNSEYNLGKEVGKDLLHYCRPAVERYIFTKLYDKLFAMYAIKNEAEDLLFVNRSRTIKKMKPREVMEYLGITQKFILESKTKNSRLSIRGILTGRSSASQSDNYQTNGEGDEPGVFDR
jgi:hypothetical protein